MTDGEREVLRYAGCCFYTGGKWDQTSFECGCDLCKAYVKAIKNERRRCIEIVRGAAARFPDNPFVELTLLTLADELE